MSPWCATRLGCLVRRIGAVLCPLLNGLLVACNNNPLPNDVSASNTLVSAVIESSPRHLDPTASY